MKNKCSIQHISIENFIPSQALVRAAAESFNQVDEWVKYSKVLSWVEIIFQPQHYYV